MSKPYFLSPGCCVEFIQRHDLDGKAQQRKEQQRDRLYGKQDSDCHYNSGEEES